jgi:hypothetical protein
MTAWRDKTAHDDAAHKEPRVRKREAPENPDNTGQGVIKDDRGQEQPTDKERATQNRWRE